jgi:putative ABC transport system permease protein
MLRHDLYLAWRYLSFHKTRTTILIACLSLMGTLPLGLHSLLDAGERQMTARAEATPLLVGAKGSSVDLTLTALYFGEAASPAITMAEADRVGASGWADPLPIYSRFRVKGQPLVGVRLDYFDYRKLAPKHGELPALLGDCVLGHDAAENLGLKPGDTLPTTPENLFDLAGVYPLKLHVTGVLAQSHTPDDQAVFVDLQTGWVIEGLGHGHTEQKPAARPQALPFGMAESTLQADARLVTYTEITPENIDSFHFHGDPAGYPISAVIALPHDRRAATLLKGRYLADDLKTQIVEPPKVTRSLLHNIFRIGALFDGVFALVGAVNLLALGLVFSLSLRLRRRELETIYLLGCSRATVFKLVLAELVLLGLAAAILCRLLLLAVDHYGETWIRQFLLS